MFAGYHRAFLSAMGQVILGKKLDDVAYGLRKGVLPFSGHKRWGEGRFICKDWFQEGGETG